MAPARRPWNGSCSTCSRSTPGTWATWTWWPSSRWAARESDPCSARLVGDAVVQALAQALDPGPEHVARLEVHRWLAGVAHPAAGAAGDQVTGPQGDRLAGVGDDLGGLEEQVRGPRLLHDGAVDLAPHLQVGRVVHVARRDQVRPGRRGTLEHLALQPLERASLP